MNRSERRTAARQANKAAIKAALRESNNPPLNPTLAIPASTPAAVAPAAESKPEPSPARLAANRANAALSTGPKTEAGKTISSQNRRTHGLTYIGGRFQVLPCENPDDFRNLLFDLVAEYSPAAPTETLLVEHMAQHQWLRDRALRLQEKCFHPETGEIADAKNFTLYLRYLTTHERSFHKCLNDLIKLRKERQALEIGFEREKRAQELHPLKKFQTEVEIDLTETRKFESEMRIHVAEYQADVKRRAASAA